MEKCVKCGKEAIVAKSYFIGSTDMFSCKKLEGAAVVGVCGDCAKPYFKKQINKNLLIAIGALAFGLFMLLTVVTDNFGSGASSSVNPIWVIAIIIASLGGSIRYFLVYGVAMKKLLRSDSEFIKEMINSKIIVKVLESVELISKNVIFNWSVLNTKRGAVDFTNSAFITEIRTPFKVGTNGKIELGGIPDFSREHNLIWIGYMDKRLDKEGTELIKQAVECYQSES